MAAPTYGTDLTLIDDAQAVANFVATGGGASGLNDETDYFINDTQCVSKNGFTATTKGMLADDVTAPTITAGDCVFIWTRQANRNILDTIANGGVQVCMGTSATAFDAFDVDGSNAPGSNLLSWTNFAVDPTSTPSRTTGSPGTYDHFGVEWKMLGSGSLKGAPNAIGVIRYGRELTIINGDVTTPATFDGAAAFDAGITRRWGLITPVPGSYQQHGAFVMGQSGTACDFRDSGRSILVLDDLFAPAGFNEFEIRNASSNVEWTGILITALGTTSPFVLTLDVGTFVGDLCKFTGADTTIFSTTGVCTNSTWESCEAVTAGGADLTGSSILTPNVAANTSGLIWNLSQDTDGSLDDMIFTKTSGTAHHAIEFGTAIPDLASYTLRGCDFGTDFSATEGGTTGDETFHFLDTTGSITLNLVGCTGNFGYRTAGVAVTIVEDPVTATFTVTDTADPPVAIASARVFMETSDGTGPLPFEDAITITQTAGTATVAHTAHGLSTGNYVVIRDATQNGYNKVASVTVTTANEYTYAVDSGTVSPATGSPIASAVIVSGLTNGSGVIADTRTYSGDQPIKGWARKSSGSPYYQNGSLSGTISSTAGFSASIALLSDE